MTETLPIGIDDIEAAAKRLEGHALKTPLLSSPLIDRRVGKRVLIKPECLQRTGSFKFRGAYNAISQVAAEGKAKGVVAFSSGNHAQGVAAAATALGLASKIVMPADSPAVKLRNTAAYGAEVVTYERLIGDRMAIAQDIAERENRVIIPPYDYLPVIAGQGTVGLEIAERLDELGLTPDAVVAPCGGGGLVAGTSVAIGSRFPDARVFAVEPEHYDDTKRSLEAGEHRESDITVPSVCDALMARTPGEITFSINRHTLAGGISVSEAQIFDAMRTAFSDLKLVIEPGGAVALASVLSGAAALDDAETVVVVISGGNVDPALYAGILEG